MAEKIVRPESTTIFIQQLGRGLYLFDIYMENALPDYLQYDFGLTKE